MRSTALALVFASLFAFTAEAKLFQNSYISFELPPNWNCKLDGTEWICTRKLNKAKKKKAIIVLAAKEKGPTDSFAAYENHLKQPRVLPKKGGGTTKSKVLHVRRRKVNGWSWVDAMHLGSEIGSYYTRYLATVKDRLGIAVTFSAHKSDYTKFANDFLKSIKTLRVIAPKNLLSKRPNYIRPSTETIGVPVTSGPELLESAELPEEPTSGSIFANKLNLLILFIIVVALGLYAYLKATEPPKRNKKKRKKRK